MKKLLILLAALSLVACSSNKPKEDMVETTPMSSKVMVEDNVVEETAMAEDKVMEEAPMTEEDVMEETVMVEETVMEKAPMIYTVVEGDNLFQIGLKYNMTWDKLAEKNNLVNPDVLEVGQELMIPAE